MKLLGSALLILMGIQPSLALNPESLDYVTRTIEYLTSVQGGAFSCVFCDFAPRNPYDNILDAILKSPRLDHVVKFVLNGTYHVGLQKLPWNPSMLLLHPGHDDAHLEHNNTQKNLYFLLELFNPTTKVFVFLNHSNSLLVKSIRSQLSRVGFTYYVFFDTVTKRDVQCNLVWCWRFAKAPHPMYLFTYGHRGMQGRNITYISNEIAVPFAWNHHWINETARYLYTDAVELQPNCVESEPTYEWCLQRHRTDQDKADILFVHMIMTGTIQRDFRRIFTSTPLFTKIAVPRDRPLNAVELIVMPFTWHVWLLLLLISISSELAKYAFPELFKNDPFLLVVCGFGRRNLHQTERWERLILHSLIMLMFFVSNAFESKIISLMVRKPVIQRIKTLDDLVDSGIKIFADLENNPHFLDNLVIRKLLVQGQNPDMYETAPCARTWYSEWVDLFIELTFDYDRMQPYYVVLDAEYSAGPEFYATKWRSLLAEEFQFIHMTLVEAGLVRLWKQQWSDEMRFKYVGRRPRVDIRDRVDLDFDDMKPAWLVLGVGLGVSFAGFAVEHIGKRLNSLLKRHQRNQK